MQLRSRRLVLLVPLLIFVTGCATTSDPDISSKPWSARMADTIMARDPRGYTMEIDPKKPGPKWVYSTAFAVESVAEVGMRGGDAKYIDYARRYMDLFVTSDGTLPKKFYKPADYKLDDILPGELLLLLYRQRHDPRYLTASRALAKGLSDQPRTADGGFWHKKIYPHQMWLDGIYMATPFMADYGKITGESKWFDEAARQILVIASHTRDPRTGLYFHGWDESKTQGWADKQTGHSPCIWGRAVGWYVMGIVDALEYMPADHPEHRELLAVLRPLADAIARAQDANSGVWYQVLDQPGRRWNYLESSASCMFVYALAKGSRLGYLDARYADVARRGYDGILRQFVRIDWFDRSPNLTDTCQVAGLGGSKGKIYRDGTFDYYVNEPRKTNDPKGLAAFILASLERESMRPARAATRAATP